jgi:hypothetical protein
LGDVVARRRTDEHEEINELLAEMRSLTPAEPGFEKRAGALYVELESHFATEEEDLFACIRAAVSPAVLRELNYRIDAAETAAPPFPEPGLKEHIHIGPAQLAVVAEGLLHPETMVGRAEDWLTRQTAAFREGFLAVQAEIDVVAASGQVPVRIALPEPPARLSSSSTGVGVRPD